jgi:hypothetical protein
LPSRLSVPSIRTGPDGNSCLLFRAKTTPGKREILEDVLAKVATLGSIICVITSTANEGSKL